MNHRQFEVRTGIVHRNPPGFDQHNLEQRIHHQYHHDDHFGRTAPHSGKNLGKTEAVRHQCERSGHQEKRRLQQGAVKRLAAGPHPVDAASCLHGGEDQHYAPQRQQIAKQDDVSIEREYGGKIADRYQQHGRHGRSQIDHRGEPEHEPRRRTVNRRLAQQRPQPTDMLIERSPLTAGQQGPCPDDYSGQHQCNEQVQYYTHRINRYLRADSGSTTKTRGPGTTAHRARNG